MVENDGMKSGVRTTIEFRVTWWLDQHHRNRGRTGSSTNKKSFFFLVTKGIEDMKGC
jgi:hypothetical protein